MAISEITNDIWYEFKKKPSVDTRNVILMHYIQLVKEVAARLAPIYKNHFEYDDLFSCGIFGLMDAIEKYDINKGVKFATYASWRIKGSIIDYIRQQDWIPKSLRQKFKSIEEAYKTIEKNTGRYPTDEEVIQYLGISAKEFEKIIGDSYYYQIISMDEQIMEIMNCDETREDLIPEQSFLNHELKQMLSMAIDQLTEKEKIVTSLYYFDELNQKEIGKVMGLTESRISQLHSKALLKLRTSIKKLKLVEI